MTVYIVYFLVFLICVFLLYTAFKAASRGMKAKANNQKNIDVSEENQGNLNISNEIEKLKKLYEQGTISKEQFEKAKDKIINN
tara:strand:+ start:654 stop:902 length:249 start_codon:yes stop_codon:yes gene_type:complete